MDKIKILLKPYISILFLDDVKAGAILLLLSLLLPSVGILGFVALISTILFAELINVREEYLKYGFYLYNSLLVGMGVGYYFEVSILTILLTMILAVFTFLISFGLNRVLLKYALPILSFPFALVSMIFYLASLKYNGLATNILHRVPIFDIYLPFKQFFTSMGTIFFLPYTIAGFIISLIILFYSRIIFFLAVMGFIIGVYIHSLFIPFNESLNSHYNFNFILISVAIGGVFLIPHIKSYIFAFIGVILSVILIDAMEVFFNLYSLPVYTLPFNVITILIILIAGATRYKYFNYLIKETPEKSLQNYLSNIFRFGGNDIKINLPFSGKWTVYQAFDGEWTHKGEWKYAYDFVIKYNNQTYKNEGKFLEDYYAFGASVLAPISGYVVDLRDDLVDNFIGNVDRINNWGNYIIIKSNYGYFVEISHLMQHSINVKIGDFVQVGQVIAKCGNSGYSPEPHIHIQVQQFSHLGSPTLPFKWIDLIKENKLYYYHLPKKDEIIESTITDKAMQLRLNFILDDIFKYEVYENETKIKDIEFKVKMNHNGEFYLSDSKNRLYFYLDEKLFYFYNYEGEESYLKNMFKLAPKIPLLNKNIEYSDILPIEFKVDKFKKLLIEFILPFNFKIFNNPTNYQKEALKISSKYGEVDFDFYQKGFKTIKFNNLELRRIDEKNTTAY